MTLLRRRRAPFPSSVMPCRYGSASGLLSGRLTAVIIQFRSSTLRDIRVECPERVLMYAFIRMNTAMSRIAGLTAPDTVLSAVCRLLRHSASSVHTEQPSPQHSWSALAIINKDEQKMTRLNTRSIITDKALFLLPFISVHLFSLRQVRAACISSVPDRIVL